MKRHFYSIVFFLCFAIATTQAQNTSPYWSLSGNSSTTATGTSKLGTTTADPLNLVTNNLTRMRIDPNGRIGVGLTTTPLTTFQVFGTTAFGNRVSSLNATRALNIIDTNAVMRILRVHPTFAPAIELISRTTADGPNVAYWDMYAEPSDRSFRIRDRVGGGSGLDRLTISRTGNVGIGTTAPASPLEVISASANSVFRAISTSSGGSGNPVAILGRSIAYSNGIGIIGQGGTMGVMGHSIAGNGWSSTGVWGIAEGDPIGYRYGVVSDARGGAYVYGLYSAASGGTAYTAAGHFVGDIYANGVLLTSDRKFKRDIAPAENSLEQLLKLKPNTYQFKKEEYKRMHLPKGMQTGLIADEVKQVFPELVQKAVLPPEYDKEDRNKVISPEVEYEAVNYIGLIPVLIGAVQDQQQTIAKQQQQIDELKQLVSKLAGGQGLNTSVNVSAAYLEQNTPNPSRGTTTIRYHVPENTSSARLILTNSKGQLLKTISINGRGTGQLNLETSALSAGVYNYTLWISGREVDTKQLVITR